jgi:predicted ATPase
MLESRFLLNPSRNEASNGWDMSILDLKIHGYRSLKDIHWQPEKLNVLIGPNGSGKSNLLRCLELISMTAKGNLGKYIQGLGGMDPIVWDGTAESIGFSILTSPVLSRRNIETERLSYELEMTRLGQTSGYMISKEILENFPQLNLRKSNEPIKLIERNWTNASIFDKSNKAIVVSEKPFSSDETILSRILWPFLANFDISAFGSYLALWRVYHDMRVDSDSVIRQSVVTRIENKLDPDGQNLISVLHTLYSTDRTFKQSINEAMSAAFGSDFEELVFPPAADQRIQLRLKWRSLKHDQSAADLSDGTLRFLMLLAILASPDPAPLIAIDEPETGLHPSMFPIIAEYAVDASERAQVILSTHSPEFLSAFKGAIPTTSVVRWKEGQTRIDILKGPDLEKWLKDYSLGALFKSGELENMADNLTDSA